jgi:GST-like protein
MIDLYTWGTPNGRKVSIMLEELGLPYKVHPINILKDDQFKPEFIAINPNSKIPAIVDPDGPGGSLPLFESGAILIYLAEKHGRFLPKDPRQRYIVMQWLMFQMGGVGPMFGQTHHFLRAAKEDVPYGKKRYHTETRRLYGVMNRRLGEARYLAGDEYTIADIATFPWVSRFEWHQVDLNEFPNVKRWFDENAARPAVQKGMAIPAS